MIHSALYKFILILTLYDMKSPFLPMLLFLSIFTLQSHPQTQVKIGKSTETVYPLTPNNTSDFDDLIPLEALLKDRKVVGMGEATHGTKEFFNMKSKMFKFLVTHCGYRIFTIEATYGGTLKVNDYILYGKGDVLSAMRGMGYWTWDTEEVKDLIEWMKTHNTGKPENEKLKFYGFDPQSYKGPAIALADYVGEFDKQNLDEFVKGLSILTDSSDLFFENPKYVNTSYHGNEQVAEISSFIQKWFAEKENPYKSASGKTKYDLAHFNLLVLQQALLLKKSSEENYGFLRDSCMAQNLRWIYELEQAKMFAWAHNGHICKSLNSFEKDRVCMGIFLDSIFGSAYYTIGFVFNKGNFQAFSWETKKMQVFTLPEYRKNTLSNALALAGPEAFFIDLTTTNNKLFSTKGNVYYIGGGFRPAIWERYSKPIIAKKQFDGLIFINTTTSAVPIDRKPVK